MAFCCSIIITSKGQTAHRMPSMAERKFTMKKFVVRDTRKSLFRKNSLYVSEHVFDHAIDAWRYAKELRASKKKDPRWPILSLEIILQ